MRSATWTISLLLVAGCRQQMDDQAKLKPLGSADGARMPVEGTVARGQLREDELLHTGRMNGTLVDLFPFEIARADLDRGRERYTVFCSHCHDHVGHGRGVVVLRGYREAASFHSDRLRAAPAGHLFDVITRGFGAMPDHAAQIPPRDRWLIVAYVRALQLSQNMRQ
jgi:mono/diheme cytochrome c family protein